MSTTIPIVFSLAPIPTGQSLDANQYGQLLIANLQASMTANFLLGQTGGSMPSNNIGPWFDGTSWWAWNPATGSYLPLISPTPFSTVQNGQMMIWQRQTTFAAVASSTITADRWRVGTTLIAGVATISRQTVNFTGTSAYPSTMFALRIQVTTAQTTIGANEQFNVNQTVERVFARPLFNQQTALSLVLQSSVIGTFCVALRSAGADWSYVMECNVTSPGMPQVFQFPSLPAMPTETGNWGTNETDGCYSIHVTATCGSTLQALPNVWATGNFISTADQTNLFSAVGNSLSVTLVQHERGTVCNPFVFRSFPEEIAICQRYYSQSYDYGIFPGTATGANSGTILYAGLASNAIGTTRFPQPMRAGPSFPATLNIYSSNTGLASRIFDNLGAVDRVVSSVNGQSSKTGFTIVVASGLSTGNVAYFHYTASADL